MTQRTYWHLQNDGRVPSEYEITTSRLLYYPERGFEVRSPVGRWVAEQQAQAALRMDDWDRFVDPRATTYASYVEWFDELIAVLDGAEVVSGPPAS